MTNQPDFDIKSIEQISKEFINRNILTFVTWLEKNKQIH